MTTRRSNTRSRSQSGASTPTSGQTRRRKIVSAATMLPLALGLAGNAASPKTPAPTAQVESVSEGSAFSQKCSSPMFPSDEPTAMDNTSCTVSGNGGAETWQNDAKNNFCPSGDLNNPILTSLPGATDSQHKFRQYPLPSPYQQSRPGPGSGPAGRARRRQPGSIDWICKDRAPGRSGKRELRLQGSEFVRISRHSHLHRAQPRRPGMLRSSRRDDATSPARGVDSPTCKPSGSGGTAGARHRSTHVRFEPHPVPEWFAD